jgi:CheY-like chemotaxis protein
VVVEDTGIGIAQDMQAHVFGEFNQVDVNTNRRFDGTGLGLAITARLVAMMGGKIWLESEPGVGSRFGFALDLAADPAAQAQCVQPLPPHYAEVWAITHGKMLPDAILAHLMRLRARLTETVDCAAGPDGPSAVVVLAPADDVIATLRGDGYLGPILCLGPMMQRDDLAPGVVPIRDAVPLLEFRAALLSDPVPPPEPIAKPPQIQMQEPDHDPVPMRPLRVLAAEDNKTNQLVFRAMLKGVDLNIEMVENGALCVAAYRHAPPDLIFTDISMPEMDGTEAATMIRQLEVELALPHVPIIAMTAHAMTGDRERILAAGIDAYMTKPLKKAELHGMIRAYTPAARGAVRGLMDANQPAPG